MHTPVVLIFFNQPTFTRRVFETIRAARPPKLFLIADAGRNQAEAARIAECRAIVEAVDWPCEVATNYAPQNMGPRARLSSGITWAFSQVDRAIIFEHDCLPHPSFFTFCEELLEKYQDDERVMHIGGSNFGQGNRNFTCPDSYYFSLVPQIWGFATWARAWKHYDVDIKSWPEVKRSRTLAGILQDPAVLERWERRFDQYHTGEAQSWDGQWAFACLVNRGLSVTPCVNLVSNIGFGPEAFTTKDPSSRFANVPLQEMHFPLRHPAHLEASAAADAYAFKYIFDVNRTVGQRARWFFRSRFHGAYAWLKSLTKTSS